MKLYLSLLNFSASIVRRLFGTLLGLVLTPVILGYLGEESFAAYRIIVDLFGQLGLLDFGLGSTLMILYSQAISKKNSFKPGEVEYFSFRKYHWVVLCQLIGLGFFIYFRERLIPVSPGNHNAVLYSLLILSIPILFVYTQAHRAYLEALHKGYLVSYTFLLQNFAVTVLSTLAAYLGWGIFGQVAVFAFCIIFSSSLIFFFARQNGLRTSRHSSEQIHKFYGKQRWAHFIIRFTGQVSLNLDNIFVAIFLGPKVVTAFYLTQRLVLIGQEQLQSVGNATWPAMSQIFHSGDKEKFSQELLLLTEVISYCAGVLLSLLAFLNPGFIILWTGQSTFAGLAVSNIVLANAGIIGLLSFWNWCFTGTGKIRIIQPLVIAQSIANVVLSYFLTKYYGVTGPVLGTLIACTTISITWENYLIHKHFSVPLLRLLKSWLLPFVVPLSISVLYVSRFGYYQFSNWFEFIAIASLSGLALSVSFYFIFISKDARTKIYKKMTYFKDKFFKS